MAYIGQESEYIEFQKQTLTADGTTTVFTLDQAAGNANGLLVSVGGVVQEPDVAYTVSAFAITFAVAPTNGYTIYIVYLGKELTVSLPADNSITANAIVNSAVTDSKITSMAASKLSGSLSGVDGSALTGIVTDTSVIEDNIAMIGFKIASNNSLTRYNMVDQVIDEYQDDVGLLTETNVDRDSSGNYISINNDSGPSVPANTITLIHSNTTDGSTTFTDSSTSSHALTAFGNVQHDTTQKKFGTTSMLFDGSGDEVKSDSTSTDWTMGTGDFTAEAWIRPAAIGSYMIVVGNSLSAASTKWRFYVDTIGNVSYGSSVSIKLTTTGSLITANNWHHISVNRISGNTVVYIDGVSRVSGADTNDYSATEKLQIGADLAGVQHPFNGHIDEILIVKGTGIRTGAFTPPTASYSAVTASATGTLISTSTTAESAPTTGDLVMLVDDPYTAATINTDIKGYVSRDGGTGWDQTTLVDQGTWGSTNKKILSAHDVAFSNSASGTDMKYKLEWANQSYTAGAPEGYAGGNTNSHTPGAGGGGGGGAGGLGDSVSSSGGGNGGVGVANSITGTSIFYAGGGGGAGHYTYSSGGTGGSSSGGNGAGTAAATVGVANTGGGGGGANHSAIHSTGTAGGSGIVVIRALTSESTGSTGNFDTTATDGNYTYWKWTTVTSAGTFTPSQSASYEYLVVAGGGGGGGVHYGGGGGAGGYRASTITVSAQVTGITVGAGGAAGLPNNVGNGYPGTNGNNSVFSSVSATGGGGGEGEVPGTLPGNGGSGGGAVRGLAGVGGTGNAGGSSPASGKETRIHATSLAWA